MDMFVSLVVLYLALHLFVGFPLVYGIFRYHKKQAEKYHDDSFPKTFCEFANEKV